MARSLNRLVLGATAVALLFPALLASAQPRIRLAQRPANSQSEEKPSAADAPAKAGTKPGDSKTNLRPEPAKEATQLKDLTAPESLHSLPALSAPTITFDPYGSMPGSVPGSVPGTASSVPPTPDAFSPVEPLYRFRVWGDFLVLQPSGAAATSFAVPVNGAIVPPVPRGAVAATDPSYQYGFRVGVGYQMRPLSEWVATYTSFKSDASAGATVDPAGAIVIDSLVIHPATLTAVPAANLAFRDATASSSLELMLGDLDYRGYITDCPSQRLDYVLGGRYARLDQTFASRFTNVDTVETVDTDITFQGGGIRVGLEGDRRSTRTGVLVYGRGFASLVAGKFESSLTQTDNTHGVANVVATTSQKEDRIVPILDLEVGIGWRSPRERFLISGGYMVSAWYNLVSNAQWIEAVQNSRFDNINDTLVFDGLVARGEFRF